MEILYEDNHLLVVVKPPGIPVQGDISGALDLLSLLKAELKERYNKPGNVFLGLVHRLDRPVGGVMVFARTSKAASRLSSQIREHKMDKTYLGVVEGCPGILKGRLTDYLLKNKRTNVVRVAEAGTPGSKEAILDYEVLETAKGLSLVKIGLLTGRSHQIRVQMANNGTPLYGDVKYGHEDHKGRNAEGRVVKDQVAKDQYAKDHDAGEEGGPALWSYQLGIEHPTKKERMLFTSSPPDSYPWNLFKPV